MSLIRKVRLGVILVCLLLPSLSTQAAPPTIGPCQVLPADNPWNTDISGAAVNPNSANIINAIRGYGGDRIHPDFGYYQNEIYGIPYIIVSGTQPKVPVTFEYDDESDPGMYPIPANAPIEGGAGASGDRHVIVVDTDSCVLYETFYSFYVGGAQGAWSAGSGAIFNLNSNALRPDGWTSADAAGLPIFPGLAKCAEANSGTIDHAFRFTVSRTQATYVYPATHLTSGYPPATYPNYPPMGMRFRMKADYPETGFTGQSLAIIRALKKYGMIVADNGSNWYISGESSLCWDNEELNQLKGIDVNQNTFEVIVSPPPAPVNLLAPTLHTPVNGAAVNTAQPILDWNTVTGASSYQVQFGTATTPTTIVATVNATSYTRYIPPNPLTSGFTYYWRVRALGGATPTGWSPIRSVVIASPLAGASTRNLFTTPTPELTWNQISWATGYEIQVSNNTAFTGSPIVQVNGNNTTFTTGTLTNGTYYWHVRAAGSTTWSPTETFIVHVPG
jgi:hypothetical protein